MNLKKVFFSGMGRMGQEILHLAEADSTSWAVTGYSAQTKKANLAIPYRTEAEFAAANFESDLVIDFSTPAVLRKLLKVARHHKLAVVSGTTGLSEADFAVLKETGDDVPVLWASNMSIGMAILKQAMQSFKGIPDFDFRIEEFHHIKKVDNPSGTALSLHAELEGVLGRSIEKPVGIRGGGIFGVHSVFAMGPEETLEFKHTALNRTVFARGALEVAAWLTNQAPGLYTMDDFVRSKVQL